jgi:uncharacterized protein (DUF2141 family)
MSNTRFSSLALFTAVAAAACTSAPRVRQGLPPHQRPEAAATAGILEVTVRGIPAVEGQLFVELYDEASYFHYERVLNERVVVVTGNEMKVSLDHVPEGRYVVVASHDANSNHRLDTNFLGLPTEVYGFSRGARGLLGPPSFADGAFDFDGSRASAVVEMR